LKTELVVALVAAVAAIVSALFSAWSQVRVTRLTAQLQRDHSKEEQIAELEQIMARFREPLGYAAYDLQSRLFGILQRNLIGTYVEQGDERSRSYVVNNTVFLIAQYFAWIEIIRKEIQFLDLGESKQSWALARLRDKVYSLWRTDDFVDDPLFRVFAGEQRAIGEQMIREGPRGPECIGYAAFLSHSEFEENPLLNDLRADVLQLRTELRRAQPRLMALQHALIDLLCVLDPDYIRFPKESRTKVGEKELPECGDIIAQLSASFDSES
jgi:hypothetical protein